MSQEYTIYDYWRIIRRRKWVIIFSVIIVIGAAHYFSLRREPVYRASAVCEVTAETVTGAGGTYHWYSAGMMETEIRVAQSRKVIERALELIGQITDETPVDEIDRLVSNISGKISVKQDGNTNLLSIEIKASQPERASILANSITESYIEVSQWQKQATIRSRREFMSSQLEYISEALRSSEDALLDYVNTGNLSGVKKSFTERLESLKLELQSLKSQYTERHPKVLETQERIKELESTLANISEERLVQQRLERDIKVNEELYFMLSRQHREMLIAAAGDPPRVRVINPAVKPRQPVSPRTAIGYGMGGMVGLVFGIILAFFKEHLDTSIGTIEELEEFLKLPVMGVIPYFTSEKDVGTAIDEIKERATGSGERSSRLIFAHKPKSTVSESFRTMETNVNFAFAGAEENTLLFTSTTMKEGKSVVVSNFALAAAQAHKKVLLVEADFRAPMLHRMFGVPKDNGLSEILIGKRKPEDVVKGTSDFVTGTLGDKVRNIGGIDDFKLITAGKLPPNPLTLFQSREFKDFLKKSQQKFDLVILDSSPILPVADSTVISSQVGGVVVVYKVGTVIRGALRRAIRQMTQTDANVLGVVLNQIRASEMKDKNFYYSYYHKYYGDEES